MSRVLLLRHGETDWNRTGRIQGWEDISLNERGRRQADSAALFLANQYPGLDRVLSSDLQRAAETASAVTSVGSFDHLTVEHDRDWRERDFGVYQGCEGDSFFQENPEFAVLDGHDGAKENVPEDGESYLQFSERVRRAWRGLKADVDDTTLVVTHSGVIRAIIATIEDAPIETILPQYEVANGSLTEVVVEEDPRLAGVNHVAHLPSSP